MNLAVPLPCLCSPKGWPLPLDRRRLYMHHMVGTGGNTLASTMAGCKPAFRPIQLTGGPDYEVGDVRPLFVEEPLLSDKDCYLYYGHNMFGMLEKAGIVGHYMTMLRHPYDRLISDFFWKVSFLPDISASQATCKFFTFVMESEHLEFYIHHCGPVDYRNSQHFNLEECSQLPNDEADKLARQNLQQRFWFVGITDMFDESLFAIARALNLNGVGPWWGRRHPKTKFRPSFFDLPRGLRQAIESKTTYDCALYEDFRADLELRFSEEGDCELFNHYFDLGHPCGPV